MGLIVKKFNYKGLVVDAAYLNIDKDGSRGTMRAFYVRINAYKDLDVRTKNKEPFTSFDLVLDLSDETITNVYKTVYAKLKETYEDAKDCKDIEKTKEPKISEVSVKESEITIKGACSGDVKISGIPSMDDCKITQKGKDFTIVLTNGVSYADHIFISAEEENCIPSEMVRVETKKS